MKKWLIELENGNKVKVQADCVLNAIYEVPNASDIISISPVKEYECQVCGAKFEDYKEFQEHEAECLGLSWVEYNTYRGKKFWTGYCLIAYNSTKSAKDKAKYNKAAESLIEFEKFYNIKHSEYELIGD